MPKPITSLQVAVPGPKGRLLSYAPPEGGVQGEVIGCRVQVPIGPRRSVGVVVGIDSNPPTMKLRPIEEILDNHPSVPADLLTLTRWVAEYYFCDWIDVLRAALPAGLMRAPDLLIEWTGPQLEGQWPHEVQQDKTMVRIARTIAGAGRLTSGQVQKQVKRAPGLYRALNALRDLDLLTLEDRQVLNRERAHSVEMVQLAEKADCGTLPANAKARIRLFDYLKACAAPVEWGVAKKEARVERNSLDALVDAGLVAIERKSRDTFTAGFDPRAAAELPELSEGQKPVVEELALAIEKGKFSPFLLSGLPGAGKTRVYVEAIQRTLAKGRGVLILVPEIGLTPQVVARIRASLPEKVAVLHSGLSAAQRVAAWREVLEGKTKVVVGPRSAIFAPIANLGLIVVDEEHEESYKQHDPAPRYHARDVALVRGKQSNATVMLVSATPSLETLRLVEEGQLKQLTLPSRFGAGWPVVTIVDRRREGPDAPYVGPHLAREIEERGKRGEGIVLLITRRGFAPVLTCTDCGHRISCPNCEVSLTYHRGERPFLRCHLCGYNKPAPGICPECRGETMTPLGAGTQRIEEEIQERFPTLAPIRMDSDTTRRSGAHERILREFGEGDAQLLLGTQVVAKGHDFAHVTLVGVVNADPALSQPDFRSSERTFRLLVQAAGRAGRGEQAGEMIVQTLAPEEGVFTSLSKPDIDGFLHTLMTQRKALSYAPYSRMAMVTFIAPQDDRARRDAESFAAEMRKAGEGLMVRGPVQAYVPRVKRQWRWRILLSTDRERDPSGSRMRAILKQTLGSQLLEAGVAVIVDIDPLEVA
ncbi:primosomal protein N' [bacterium]|nr:primosomal protein N' [bacterium]